MVTFEDMEKKILWSAFETKDYDKPYPYQRSYRGLLQN